MGAVIPSRQMWQSPFAEEAARKSAHVIDDASVPATVKHLAEPTNNASFSLKQTGELTERAFSADPRHGLAELVHRQPCLRCGERRRIARLECAVASAETADSTCSGERPTLWARLLMSTFWVT